jgi:hypothetical protein
MAPVPQRRQTNDCSMWVPDERDFGWFQQRDLSVANTLLRYERPPVYQSEIGHRDAGTMRYLNEQRGRDDAKSDIQRPSHWIPHWTGHFFFFGSKNSRALMPAANPTLGSTE